jgi:hypothetical protein
MAPINEYENILMTGQVPSGGNEYVDMLHEEQGSQKQALQQSMFVAARKEPDQHARVLELSKKTNLPSAFVERNYEKLAQKQAQQGTDYDQIISETPGLAAWLQEPDNAAIARDDIEGLAQVERSLKSHREENEFFTLMRSAMARANARVAKIPAALHNTTAVAYNELVADPVNSLISGYRLPKMDYATDAGPVADIYDETVKANRVAQLENDMLAQIKKGDYSGAGKTLVYSIAHETPNFLIMMAAGVANPAAGMGYAMGTSAAESMDENMKEGVDPARGVPNALIKGSIEGLAERLGSMKQLEKWKGLITKQYGEAVTKEVMKGFAANFATTFGTGAAEESITSLGQDFTDRMMIDSNAMEGAGSRAFNAGLVGGFMEGGMTVPGGVAQGLAVNAQRRRVEGAKNFYLSLGQSLEASKLRQRLPDAQKAFVEQVTKGGPVENVYIPVEALESYFQGANQNPVAVMQKLGTLQAYEEAKQTGGDVKIPLATWAHEIVGTEHYQGLANDIKFNPMEMTVNEEKAFQKEAASVMERLSSEAAEAESKAEDPAKAIGTQVVEQLIATGAMNRDQATKQASVVEAAFRTLSKRTGIDVGELWNRYGLQIRGPNAPAEAEGQTPMVDLPAPPAPEAQTLGGAPLPEVDFTVPDELDPILDAIRGGNLFSDQQVKGASLLDFIRQKGGIRPDTEGLDVRSMDPDAARKPFQRKIIQKNGRAADEIAQLALESGYLQSGDVNELLEAIGDELRGNPRFSSQNIDGNLSEKQALMQSLIRQIGSMGLDLNSLGNAEVKKALLTQVSEQLPEEDRIFLQTLVSDLEVERWERETPEEFKKQYRKGKDLTPLQRRMEIKAAWIVTRPDAVERYKALPKSLGGKLLDTDLARELLPEYAESKEGRTIFTDSTHGPMSQFVWQMFLERLKEEPVSRKAMLMGGVTGAGKSTVLDSFEGDTVDQADLIYDGTMASLEDARERLLLMEAAGLQAQIVYVYKPLEEAARGVAKRFDSTGRPVPAPAVVASAISSLNSVLAIASDPRFKNVEIKAYDTTGDVYRPISLEQLAKLRYTESEEGQKELLERTERILQHVEEEKQTALKRRTEAGPEVRDSGSRAEAGSGRDEAPGRGDGSSSEEGLRENAGDERGDDDGGITSLDQSGQSDDFSARGRIRFGKNRKFTIELLKKADASTFIHELGHFYLEVLSDLSASETAPEQIKQDMKTLIDWLKDEEHAGPGFSVKQHEQFARGFEAYIMEGKAPSSALRKAFAAFRVWLTAIYRELRSLNVQLTDDVRSVMDRLIATDQEIEAAQAEMGHAPLFPDPKVFGMTDEQMMRYLNAVDEAKEEARAKLEAKVMADYQRAKEAWYKEKRAEVRARVERDVAERKVYRALRILQRGELPDGTPFEYDLKIDRDLLRKEDLKGLPRGISRPGGTPVQVVAEMLGFASGDDLILQLTNARPKAEVIEELVNAEMQELHPDILLDGRMQEEALKAIHTEKRAELLRLELEHLARNHMPVLKNVIRKVARRVPTSKAIREQAIRIVAARNVKDLKPHLFQRAEVKAAKQAGEALARGDLEAAFDAKQRELMNHELYLATVAAQEDVENSLEKFKRLAKSDEKLAKGRDTDLVSAARAVLAQFGIGKVEKAPAEYLEKIQAYDPETYNTVVALVNSATENAQDYRDIKYDDFVAMRDAVMAMWDLSRTSRQIEIDGVVRDREEVSAELEARISEITQPGNKAGYDRAATEWDQVKMYLLSALSAGRRVESWVDAVDGGAHDGVFRRYILNPILTATSNYRQAKKVYLKKYLDIVSAVASRIDEREINAPELGYRFKGKAELLGAMLHIGNESNLEKLLLGRPNWGRLNPDGSLDTGNWDAFMARLQQEGVLEKADFDFLQAVWDLNEELKPEAQKAHKKMYGFYFNEITAREFRTSFGVYRGGYVPAVADPFMVEDAAIRNDKEILEKSNNSFMFPTAGRGFTKSRVQQYHAPLLLDLRGIPAHLDKVLRFVHIEPAVKQVGGLVTSKSLKTALAQLDPTVRGEMLIPWLQRAAQQRVQTPSQGWAGKALDKVAGWLRTRTGMQAMVLNLVNAMQQLTGFSMAAVKVKPKYLRNALWSYIRSPKAVSEMVIEKSKFMQTRLSATALELQSQIDDLILNPSKFEQVRDFANKHGYILQSGFQNVVDSVVWSGAYDEAVGQGLNELEAVRAADAAVRQTQGSFAPEDMSRIESGTPFMRLFTMFYSYFNMQANLLGTEFVKVMQDGGFRNGVPRLAYVYTMGFMIPAVLAELIVRSMGSGIDEDDDDEYLDDLMAIFFGSQFRTATAMLPGAGQVVNATVNFANNKRYDDRITASPAITTLESVAKAPSSIAKAVSGEGSKKVAVRDALNVIGLATGVPVSALGRPIGYGLDWAEGKTRPKNAADAVRGLATGKASDRY